MIVQHKPGHWSFPKGHKEGSETDLESAKRELWEETGITNCNIQEEIIFKTSHVFEQKGLQYHKTNTYYLSFTQNKDVQIPDEWKHEIVNAKWCTYQEAKTLINFTPVIQVLDEVKDYLLKEFKI